MRGASVSSLDKVQNARFLASIVSVWVVKPDGDDMFLDVDVRHQPARCGWNFLAVLSREDSRVGIRCRLEWTCLDAPILKARLVPLESGVSFPDCDLIVKVAFIGLLDGGMKFDKLRLFNNASFAPPTEADLLRTWNEDEKEEDGPIV